MSVAELSRPLESKTTSAFRHILVAVDFSEASRRALCDAMALAAESNARLSVIHVLHPDRKHAPLETLSEIDPERVAAEKRIKALVSGMASEQNINKVLAKRGPVSQQVASFIEQEGIDLLVIGTRGRGGLQKLALGSVAEELLRVAPCPVMTIGPRADIAAITHGAGFHTILFATDFGSGSVKALPLTLALARTTEAHLILLHMIPPMPASSGSLAAYAPATAAADEVRYWEETSRNRALKQLRGCLPADPGLKYEPEYIVGTNFLAEGLLTAVDRLKVDLIVMGANHAASARTASHIPWSAIHEVLRNAPCPVLTVAG
jgi:nucleotide-binding universal stress UspA family protein